MQDYMYYSDDELYHWGIGFRKAGAKYISRVRKNGKWVYTYATDVTNKAGSQAKSVANKANAYGNAASVKAKYMVKKASNTAKKASNLDDKAAVYVQNNLGAKKYNVVTKVNQKVAGWANKTGKRTDKNWKDEDAAVKDVAKIAGSMASAKAKYAVKRVGEEGKNASVKAKYAVKKTAKTIADKSGYTAQKKYDKANNEAIDALYKYNKAENEKNDAKREDTYESTLMGKTETAYKKAKYNVDSVIDNIEYKARKKKK